MNVAGAPSRIILPAGGWHCRDYQRPLWHFMDGGGLRAALKWHRRSGKDTTALRWTTVASQRRIGAYWHMLPTLRQARKVIWEGIVESDNPNEPPHRQLDAWPGWREPDKRDEDGGPVGLVRHVRHDEMKLELHNGSIWYCVGSDNYDALVGTNPIGVVFSEWSLSDPNAWNYIRPILSENGGWAIFIWTPRGQNHAAKLFRNVKDLDEWFAEKLTVDDTKSISLAKIDLERREGASEEHLLQEYWCSEDAPLIGSYYGDQMIAAQKDGRICRVPHDPALKVDTWSDLGHSDAFATWFVQQAGPEFHVIDYWEANGALISDWASMLEDKRQERSMIYGRHLWPHDGGHKTLASKGQPLSAMAGDLGIDVEVQPRTDVLVGIHRVRQILPRCWFDEDRCEDGLIMLRSYRKDQDESKSTEDRPYYKPTPRHDFSSHGADGFRTGAMAHHDPRSAPRKRRDRYSGGDTRTPRSPWSA